MRIASLNEAAVVFERVECIDSRASSVLIQFTS